MLKYIGYSSSSVPFVNTIMTLSVVVSWKFHDNALLRITIITWN